MNFKKNVMAALFATTLTAAVTPAMADDPSTLTFDLEATIPVARYYVKFNTPTFPDAPHTMHWDNISETLGNVSTQLKAKNTVGNITAHLDSAAELVHITDGSKKIPLEVKIGTEALSVGNSQAVEILPASETAEVLRTLVVSPQTSPAPAYDPGSYEGTVTMMFDYDI